MFIDCFHKPQLFKAIRWISGENDDVVLSTFPTASRVKDDLIIKKECTQVHVQSGDYIVVENGKIKVYKEKSFNCIFNTLETEEVYVERRLEDIITKIQELLETRKIITNNPKEESQKQYKVTTKEMVPVVITRDVVTVNGIDINVPEDICDILFNLAQEKHLENNPELRKALDALFK